jgi:hypothetical protein
MKPSNHPDIGLAQEWVLDLDSWIRAHGLKGYDPFDVKAHPAIRAQQTHPLRRKATTLLCDVFPYWIRERLNIPQTENAKAFALVAMGSLRLHEIEKEGQSPLFDSAPQLSQGVASKSGDCPYLGQALDCLEWVRAHSSEGYSGLCWGYPFDVFGTGVDTPAGTPISVVSAIAGEAFVHAYRVTGEESYLRDARSICDFLLQDLPRLKGSLPGYCFAYTPSDQRRVHNASLLTAEHLMRVWAVTQEEALREAALPAIEFSLAAQREDGAWPYGDYAEGDPYEPALMSLVDHHHTGFVLRSIYGIHTAAPDPRLEDALRKGWNFYRKKLFTEIGQPLTEHGRWPVDIHACAEGILCPAVLSAWRKNTIVIGTRTLRWSHFYMRSRVDQTPYYRKYPRFTSKLLCTRWGLAWMYRAMAEYYYQHERLMRNERDKER